MLKNSFPFPCTARPFLLSETAGQAVAAGAAIVPVNEVLTALVRGLEAGYNVEGGKPWHCLNHTKPGTGLDRCK